MDQKQKILLIAAGALCGLIVLFLAFRLAVSIGAASDSRAELKRAERTIAANGAERPYPSKENRDTREQDAKAAAAVADQARALLTHGLPIPQGETVSQFADRLVKGVHALNERQQTPAAQLLAAAQQQQQAQSYSFESYVAQGNLPKDKDLPRLARQFAVIEHACNLLLDNGAVSIVEVTRDRFDGAAVQEEEPRPTRRSRRSRRDDEEQQPAAPVGAPVDPILAKDGVTRESYAIRFNAPYDTVVKTLNTLATEPLFVVVTDLSVTRKTPVSARVDELVTKRQAARQAAARRAASSRDPDAQQRAAEIAAKPLFEGASPAERVVTDPEHAIPLDVLLRFDVYSAAPAEAPPAPAPEKEGN